MRLVDSLPEQEILERLLEQTKPPVPELGRNFHYLLSTPFRYPSPYGSRFRRPRQREGVFYSSEDAATAICEVAFYKFLFRADAPDAAIPSNPIEHTVFGTACETRDAIDLTSPPFDSDAASWELLDQYGPCQDLADSARTAGVQAIRYRCVRDILRRANVAILSPGAFAETKPRTQQSWRLLVKAELIVAYCENPKGAWEFPLSLFLADPRLASLQQQ